MDAPPNEPPLPAGGDDPASVPPPWPPPPLPSPAPAPRPNGLAFFAVVLVLFVALGSVAQGSNAVLGLAWSEVFALLVPAVVVAAGSNLDPWRGLLLARRPGVAALLLAAVIGAVGFLGAGALMALTSLVLPPRWTEIFDLTKLFDLPPLQRAALAVAASTLAPLCEEIAFRGWLLTALRARHGHRAAIALSALCFAIMHLDPIRFSALFALGLLYGWMAWRAGSVWPAFVAHAANNALGVTLASLGAAGGSLHAARARPFQVATSALITITLMAAILRVAAAAYRRATAAPPDVSELLCRRDPGDRSTRFDFDRVPRALLVTLALGAASLVALVLAARRR